MSRRLLAIAALLAVATAVAPATGAPLIAIDPGHGGGDSGATGTLPPGTATGLTPRIDPDGQTRIYEKDVNLDVAQRVNAALTARGYGTLMTRTQDLAGGDVPYTTTGADLSARTDLANNAKADLFVSIHSNALSETSSGTETYHFYYAGAGSQALAALIHERVVASLGLPDRGIKTAGFYVLKNTTMPAVLVEGAFLSNPTEALRLADPNVRQVLADAITGGVVEYVDRGYLTTYATPVVSVPRYQVNAGAFLKLADARQRYRVVRKRGFSAAIRSEYHTGLRRNLFFVVSGRFINFDNATTVRTQMRNRGIRANVGLIPSTSRKMPVR